MNTPKLTIISSLLFFSPVSHSSPGTDGEVIRRQAAQNENVAACPSTLRVKRVDEMNYKIKGHELVACLNNATLESEARFVPFMEDGKQVGYKMFGIKQGSLLKKLQFHNGDVLIGVNKILVDSGDAARKALEHAKTAKKLVMRVIKKGEPTLLVYWVDD